MLPLSHQGHVGSRELLSSILCGKIVTTGEYPGDGLPKPVAFPDPTTPGVTTEIEGVRVVTLEKLIELKLASGMSAPHRLRDLADVQDLIVRLRLPLMLADRLDPSVQAAYRELWEMASPPTPAISDGVSGPSHLYASCIHAV